MDSAENLNTDAQKNAMKDILPANIVQDVTMLESANTTASTPQEKTDISSHTGTYTAVRVENGPQSPSPPLPAN